MLVYSPQIKLADDYFGPQPQVHPRVESLPQFFPSFFIPVIDGLVVPIKRLIERVWCILSLQMDKVVSFFQRIIVKEEYRQKEAKEKVNLTELFCQPVVYETFRDRVLTYREKNELGVMQEKKPEWFYNNYDLESYLHVKSHHLDILDQYTTQREVDLIAGIRTYEVIVDLYVRRFLQTHPEMDHERFLPSLRVTALGIALKMSEDDAIWISDFQDFLAPFLKTNTHADMEVEFLKEINWDASFTEIEEVGAWI